MKKMQPLRVVRLKKDGKILLTFSCSCVRVWQKMRDTAEQQKLFLHREVHNIIALQPLNNLHKLQLSSEAEGRFRSPLTANTLVQESTTRTATSGSFH